MRLSYIHNAPPTHKETLAHAYTRKQAHTLSLCLSLSNARATSRMRSHGLTWEWEMPTDAFQCQPTPTNANQCQPMPGMLVESMAAKAGALHGVFQDGTPFRFHEKQRSVDYFGEQLKTAGYSYVGSEPLVRACLRACVRMCVRACVRACVRECVST